MYSTILGGILATLRIFYHFFPISAFLLSARFAPAGDTSITLPLPVDESMVKDSSIHSKACLPVMKDYYRWVWNIKTFPYRSLNESSDLSSVEDGDCVEILRYESTEEGIKTSSSKVFTYDAEFRKVCDTEIDGLGEGAIETFLKKQNTSDLCCDEKRHANVAGNFGDFLHKTLQPL